MIFTSEFLVAILCQFKLRFEIILAPFWLHIMQILSPFCGNLQSFFVQIAGFVKKSKYPFNIWSISESIEVKLRVKNAFFAKNLESAWKQMSPFSFLVLCIMLISHFMLTAERHSTPNGSFLSEKPAKKL